MSREDFWKRKLMAYLHDPPCKALDFSRKHEEIARALQKAAIPGQDEEWHRAVSKTINDSDWFAAEADRLGFGKGQEFTPFANQSKFRHPMGGGEYEFRAVPELALAEEILQQTAQGIEVDSDASPEEQARQKFFFFWRRWMDETVRAQEGKGREMAFFPADTRIPDHTIWNHMSLASALQGCRDDEHNIKVSFLMFQLGPVQDFIAQARSTRDLWSGSYLLSWLTGCAIKAITDKQGPDSVIFPALRSQGVFDALHQELFSKIKYGGDTLWERLYRDGSRADKVKRAQKLLSPTLPNRFFAIIPQGEEDAFSKMAENAVSAELNRISESCWEAFRGEAKAESRPEYLAKMKQRWNRQVALFVQTSWAAVPLKKIGDWQDAYAELTALMAARRNTRDFKQYTTDQNQRTARKDALSGKEEVIGDKDIWKALHSTEAFKDTEGPYGAITIIKRLWCRSETDGGLLQKLHIDETVFKEALKMNSMPDIAHNNELSDEEKKEGKKKSSNPYVAIIALDGDQIGKWLSGENMPCVESQVPDSLKGSVCGARKLTPSYHMQFSEALANFATYLSRRIVNHYDGLLVYAGGDDVLAIVPSSKALDCAADLRALFKGKACDLSTEKNQYQLGITQDGFVLADEAYPLIVPGPAMDASCGIAVGHCQYPLQALVQEAKQAEKRAKDKYAKNQDGDYLGGAFALSLIKRSGEIIEWGARWEQKALSVYRDFTQKTKSGSFSGRLPYALAELLNPYDLNKSFEPEFKEVIATEFKHVEKRQAMIKEQKVEGVLEYLDEVEGDRIMDFQNLFLASAFMNRQRGDH